MTAIAPELDKTSVGYPLYDADEHYYENVDTWTRHLPKESRNAIRWAQIDGKRRLLVADKLWTMNSDPAFARVGAPGVLGDFFRGINPEGKTVAETVGDQIETVDDTPPYRDRDARLRTLDEQGVIATNLFPTSGVGMEEMLRDRPTDLYNVVGAFNRWLEDEWGYAYQDRIHAVPMISLIDPDKAVAELERVRDRGAKWVVMVAGPIRTGPLSWSPGDRRYDRFWATAAEANMTVAYHGGDSGYHWVGEKWGEGAFTGIETGALSEVMELHIERPIQDTMAAIVCHGVFDRHPTLRIATIEVGSHWAIELFFHLKKSYGKLPMKFQRDPVESFKEHVWIAPFYEDNIVELRDEIGADHILFGSDWPHPEGLRLPIDYLHDIAALSPAEQKMIMSDNLKGLLHL
jgi:predicted TIM-barrel fold metal-dependent hydrolase